MPSAKREQGRSLVKEIDHHRELSRTKWAQTGKIAMAESDIEEYTKYVYVYDATAD
jgi:hypothetical protein